MCHSELQVTLDTRERHMFALRQNCMSRTCFLREPDVLILLANSPPQPAMQKLAATGHMLVCTPRQACGVNNIAA